MSLRRRGLCREAEEDSFEAILHALGLLVHLLFTGVFGSLALLLLDGVEYLSGHCLRLRNCFFRVVSLLDLIINLVYVSGVNLVDDPISHLLDRFPVRVQPSEEIL